MTQGNVDASFRFGFLLMAIILLLSSPKTQAMLRRNFVLLALSSSQIIISSFIIHHDNRHLINLSISRKSLDKRKNSRLAMTALPSIEAMRTIEIRRELESYGIQVRSSWGGEELAETLGRTRAEIAVKRRAAKKKSKQRQQENVDKTENLDPQLDVESPTKHFPFIDVEHVPDQKTTTKAEPVAAEKKRKPIISRIGGFLSRRKHKKSPGRESLWKKTTKRPAVSPPRDPLPLNATAELPFFLEFLEKENADTGPISVEVVRLKTEVRYSEEDELDQDAKGGRRKRLLYTRGLGRSRRSKKSKVGCSNTVIAPMGEFSSNPNFIDTYSRGERRIEYQHHFQVLQDDESTTHKLQQGDPTLVNCTVIDVPATDIHFDYRDPNLFSNLRCDDWDGFSA